MNSHTLTLGRAPASTLEIAQRREAAERFIETSGDGQAIRSLAQLRREREGWFDSLRRAATHQTTLKVALGVFLGVVAAEAALALLRSDALGSVISDIEKALTRFDALPDPAPLAMDSGSAPGIAPGSAPGIESGIDSATDALSDAVSDAVEDATDFIADLGSSLFD